MFSDDDDVLEEYSCKFKMIQRTSAFSMNFLNETLRFHYDFNCLMLKFLLKVRHKVAAFCSLE